MPEESVGISISSISSLIIFIALVIFLLAVVAPGFRNWIKTLMLYITSFMSQMFQKICPFCYTWM